MDTTHADMQSRCKQRERLMKDPRSTSRSASIRGTLQLACCRAVARVIQQSSLVI
jgi:hypothetical protein